MEPIEERKKKQLRFMKLVYDETNGTPDLGFADPEALGRSMGLDRQESIELVNYLRGKGLVAWSTNDTIGITPLGVEQVEEAETNPKEATAPFFAPYSVVFGDVRDSQIQVGTDPEHSGQSLFGVSASAGRARSSLARVSSGPGRVARRGQS